VDNLLSIPLLGTLLTIAFVLAAIILLRKAKLKVRLLMLKVITYALIAIISLAAAAALTSPSKGGLQLLAIVLALPIALWILVYKMWMD